MPVPSPTIIPTDDTGTLGDNITAKQLNVHFAGSDSINLDGLLAEWRLARDLGPDGIDNDGDGTTDEAGEDIELLDMVSFSIDPTNLTFEIGVNLSAGTHNLLFFNPTALGPDSVSATVTFTILGDTTSPDLAAADDTGVSNTDNITNQSTGLTYSGTSTASGQSIELYDYQDNSQQLADGLDNDGDAQIDEADEGEPTLTLLGTTTSTAGGAWSIDASMAEGEHSLVVRVDGGELNGLTDVTVDTTTPQFTFASVLLDGSVVLQADEFLRGVIEAGDFTVLVDGIARTVVSATVFDQLDISKVVLIFADPIERFENVDVTYNAAAGTPSSIQDVAGNSLPNVSFTDIQNNSELDTTTPFMVRAEPVGETLLVQWSEGIIGVGEVTNLEPGDFTVTVDGITIVVLSAQILDSSSGLLELQLASPIGAFSTATLNYSQSAGDPDTVRDIDPTGGLPDLVAETQTISISPNTAPQFEAEVKTLTLAEDSLPLMVGVGAASVGVVSFSDPDLFGALSYGTPTTYVGAVLTDTGGISSSFSFSAIFLGIGISSAGDGTHDITWGLLGPTTANMQFLSTGETLTLSFDLQITDGPGSDTIRFDFVIQGQNEIFTGGSLDDNLTGTNFADNVSGAAGDDLLNGLAGNDIIVGASGDDTANGGGGNDSFNGGSGDDVLNGGSGNDSFIGGSDSDILFGGSGDDTLAGNSGADELFGGSGNDTLQGGTGFDTMKGGDGDDVYLVDVDDSIIESSNSGTDIVRAQFSYVLDANVENLVILGTAAFSGTGNSSSNTIAGNEGANTLNGMDGADILLGGLGADTLIGGDGADIFRFELATSSRNANGVDTIQGFSLAAGDRIDMSLIDADSLVAGDQGFLTQVASGTAFSAAGQFRLTAITGGFRMDFNTNSTAAADMTINVLTTDSASGALEWLLV